MISEIRILGFDEIYGLKEWALFYGCPFCAGPMVSMEMSRKEERWKTGIEKAEEDYLVSSSAMTLLAACR